jgi:hypothetical protein
MHSKGQIMSFAMRLVAAVIVGAILLTTGKASNAWAAPAAERASRAEVQVDLFRGLADIFSRGMDTLTHRLNQEGYTARVYSTNQWPSAAQRIADQYSRGHKVIVVLIGHSLGGNAIFDAAYELDRRNIPVELLVSFDATNPRPVPKNVLHVVNFFQQNGFGKQVSPGSEFKGKLTNIDLTADTGLSHTTIDKSPRLHAMVMRKIADVVEEDLAKTVKASKKKTVKKKKTPTVPAAQ